jgi:hypothetical protein
MEKNVGFLHANI